VLATRFEVLLPHLNERQQRLALATEARLLGYGGCRHWQKHPPESVRPPCAAGSLSWRRRESVAGWTSPPFGWGVVSRPPCWIPI
jgi:hypothetical protein